MPDMSSGTNLPASVKLTFLRQYTTSIAIAHIGNTLPRYMMKSGVLFLNNTKGRNLIAIVVREITIAIIQLCMVITSDLS